VVLVPSRVVAADERILKAVEVNDLGASVADSTQVTVPSLDTVVVPSRQLNPVVDVESPRIPRGILENNIAHPVKKITERLVRHQSVGDVTARLQPWVNELSLWTVGR
jgi:hypothetical protein